MLQERVDWVEGQPTEVFSIAATSGEQCLAVTARQPQIFVRHDATMGPCRHPMHVACPHAGKPSLQLVLFPGNPGSARLYLPLLRALHAKLHGRADVAVYSHLNHSAGASGQVGRVRRASYQGLAA